MYVLVCIADDFQLETVVTVEGNLMLTVTLLTAILGPVKLRMKYTSAVQSDPEERNTSIAFENREEIVHEVSRSEVPFQQFRLQVALQVDGVVGPFVPELENASVNSKCSGMCWCCEPVPNNWLSTSYLHCRSIIGLLV